MRFFSIGCLILVITLCIVTHQQSAEAKLLPFKSNFCREASCVKPNKVRNSLSKTSHIEDIEGAPELFNVLVSSPADDPDYNWNIFTFQVDFDRTNDKNLDEALKERNNMITVNCTVIYLDQCTSWNKCRQTCQSTGASSYRWFHDGCCECVGSTCINYGVNESRCRNCPEEFDDGLDEDIQDHGDYEDLAEEFDDVLYEDIQDDDDN